MSPPPYQSQTSQALSLVHHFDLDDDFDPFFCSRAYFTSHGLGGPSVPVQDDSPSEEMVPVFSTWMAFEGNTRDLGSFEEETDKITDLHQIHEEVLFTERGDGTACIKRRHRDLSSDVVRDLVTASGGDRLKEDLESFM
ncbi:hypothetical protein Tco_0019473 [Tanacetum coccineum]